MGEAVAQAGQVQPPPEPAPAPVSALPQVQVVPIESALGARAPMKTPDVTTAQWIALATHALALLTVAVLALLKVPLTTGEVLAILGASSGQSSALVLADAFIRRGRAMIVAAQARPPTAGN